MFSNNPFERHFAGSGRHQIATLTIEVTTQDRSNMEEMVAASGPTEDVWSNQEDWATPVRPTPSMWKSLPAIGSRYSFEISDGTLGAVQNEQKAFLEYLTWYDLDSSIRDRLGLKPLGFPMLSLPVRRSANGFSTYVSLPGFNEFDLRRSVDAANSRLDANLASLATGRLAAKYRELLSKHPKTFEEEFYGQPNVLALTQSLREIGYDWKLVEISAQKNEYDIQLSKQGSTFRAGAASSGEKELLTYLFAIYALNVRDSLVVIDEPELHLHPRWQVTLLNLFERLADSTGNQFVMATHSPAFISPASIQYVSRVYSADQASRIVRLDSSALPERKHLFNIVNSFNNERIFFTDKVILVEGISDRIFFEAVLRKFKPKDEFGQPYEVVSVGGKFFFERYASLLDASKVKWCIVADRDYASDVGDADVKGLFRVDAGNLKSDVIENPKSLDGEELLRRLDDAIGGGESAKLIELWSYVRSRRLRLIDNLSGPQLQVLEDFIQKKRTDRTFILKAGALEAYLPPGHGRKDLDPLIALVADEFFWEKLPDAGKAELELIAGELLKA